MLEFDDIQSAILHPRPLPYVATFLMVRIDDRNAGRALMRRAHDIVGRASQPTSPVGATWISVALTFQGLKALGIPQTSLDSFPIEFQQGMVARADVLGDRGESSPKHWEKPLGEPDAHVLFAAVAPDAQHLAAIIDPALDALAALQGVKVIWRQDCHMLPTGREAFGYKDNISHPAIEGSGVPPTNLKEAPLKAGEFLLGYLDETGKLPPMPVPEELGRNGTYVAFRKLHQRVAEYRRFLKSNAATVDEEELLAAKMMGRWRSGAPLALSPEKDDPELGADPKRNNDFLYHENDAIGFNTPPCSHIRRANPRDGLGSGGSMVRIRRMIRRGASYGPPLPEGVIEDDGVDRGFIFLFIGAHLGRQFEFVQSLWMNDSEFIATNTEKDPVVGARETPGTFIIPRWPVRRVVQGLPRFVITRGGEYCFMPSLRALAWIGALDT